MKFTCKEFAQFYNDRKEELERKEHNLVVCSVKSCQLNCQMRNSEYSLRELINPILYYASTQNPPFEDITIKEGIFSVKYKCDFFPTFVKLTCKLNIQEHNQLSLF